MFTSPAASAVAAARDSIAMARSSRSVGLCGAPLPPPPPHALWRDAQRTRRSPAANCRLNCSFGTAPSTQCCNNTSSSPATRLDRNSKNSKASKHRLTDASSMMCTCHLEPTPLPQPSGSRSELTLFVMRTTRKSDPKGKRTSSTALPFNDICFGKLGFRSSGRTASKTLHRVRDMRRTASVRDDKVPKKAPDPSVTQGPPGNSEFNADFVASRPGDTSALAFVSPVWSPPSLLHCARCFSSCRMVWRGMDNGRNVTPLYLIPASSNQPNAA
mmetsp:Transcript_22455/g.62818  ORF Transcript_22455/g.62818 Transcript_22455/m.62818 type:complete len:272 (-) Transcript_22455:1118-1933(-)